MVGGYFEGWIEEIFLRTTRQEGILLPRIRKILKEVLS
jgi:hypothetical protein